EGAGEVVRRAIGGPLHRRYRPDVGVWDAAADAEPVVAGGHDPEHRGSVILLPRVLLELVTAEIGPRRKLQVLVVLRPGVLDVHHPDARSPRARVNERKLRA